MPPNPNSVAAERRGQQLDDLNSRIAGLENERDRWREHARTWEKRAKKVAEEHDEQTEKLRRELENRDQQLETIKRDLSTQEQQQQRYDLAKRHGLTEADADLFLNRDTPEENERIAAKLRSLLPKRP